MLSYLKIDNYALIEREELEFSPAFNVVTGESGAGKSILMGALEFLIGGRTDRGALRSGSDRCTVSGIFPCPRRPPRASAHCWTMRAFPSTPARGNSRCAG